MAAGVSRVGRSPFAFVSFGRCTPARRHGALPSSPSVIPAQCKPVRGRGNDRLSSSVVVSCLVEPRSYLCLLVAIHVFRPTVRERLAMHADPVLTGRDPL